VTVWERRDLPLLRVLAASEDEHIRAGYLHVGHSHVGERLGLGKLDDYEIHDGLAALWDAGYIEFDVSYSSGPGATLTNLRVTGTGQQALGQWPLFDEVASPKTLALFLECQAKEAPTEEEAENMRRAARYIRTLGALALRSALTGALSRAARIALGI
jgi:hypothetical protein